MTTTTPAVTGFGFQRQMARADFKAFRRWYEARCLLVASAEARDRTFSAPADAPAEMQAMAEAA